MATVEEDAGTAAVGTSAGLAIVVWNSAADCSGATHASVSETLCSAYGAVPLALVKSKARFFYTASIPCEYHREHP